MMIHLIKLINFLQLHHILEGKFDSRELMPINFNLVRLPYDIEEEVKLLQQSKLPSRERLIAELRSATNCRDVK